MVLFRKKKAKKTEPDAKKSRGGLFSRAKLRTKLTFGIGIMIGILIVSFAFTAYLVMEIRDAQEQVHVISEIGDAVEDLNRLIQKKYILALELVYRNSITAEEELQQEAMRLDAIKETLSQSLVTREQKALFIEMQAYDDEFQKAMAENVLPALRKGDKELAMVWMSPLAEIANNFINRGEDLHEELHREQDEALSYINQVMVTSLRNMGIVLGIAILASLVIFFVVTRIVVNPLKQLVGISQKIAVGDLTGKELEIKTQDEMGQLLMSFNEMNKNLRALVSSITNTAQEVSAASQELAASSTQVGDGASQVASTVQEMAKGIGELSQQAESLASLGHDLLNNINRVDEQAQSMGEGARQVAQVVKAGGETTDQAVRQMSVIEEMVASTLTEMDKFEQSAKEIGQIVELITSIADQTNLLALNAAIEAARAGEQGRGFAVVAEEVRKLAEQAGEAAQGITKIIQEMQLDAGRAATNMHQSAEEVRKGGEVMASTHQAFLEINRVITGLLDQAAVVANLSKEMGEKAEEMSSAVDNVAAIAQENDAAALEIAGAAEEQSAAVEQIASSVNGLAELAQKLNRAVDQFTLE
jgi:methyl-accepting chemotaxis protein